MQPLLVTAALAWDGVYPIRTPFVDCERTFDPAQCEYPLLDPVASHRFDVEEEVSALDWATHNVSGVLTPRLATGDVEGHLAVYETEFFYSHPSTWATRTARHVAYDTAILSLRWSPDGTRLAIASGENDVNGYPNGFGQLTIFDTASWSLMEPTRLPAGCSRSGHHWHVVTGVESTAAGCVSGFSDEDQQQLLIADQPGVLLKQGGGVARAVAWSPDGGKVAVGFDNSAEHGHYLFLVNATSGEREVLVGTDADFWSAHVSDPTSHEASYPIHALAWSPGGDWLAMGTGASNSLVLLNMSSHRLVNDSHHYTYSQASAPCTHARLPHITPATHIVPHHTYPSSPLL